MFKVGLFGGHIAGSCFFIQSDEELIGLFDCWRASVTANGSVFPNKCIHDLTGGTCGDAG